MIHDFSIAIRSSVFWIISRRFVYILSYLASSRLSGFQKKCSEGIIAIAHDDDLQIFENMVRPRQMFELGVANKTRA
jgi:hypothetical protein